jgi:hypothetical protein
MEFSTWYVTTELPYPCLKNGRWRPIKTMEFSTMSHPSFPCLESLSRLFFFCYIISYIKQVSFHNKFKFALFHLIVIKTIYNLSLIDWGAPVGQFHKLVIDGAAVSYINLRKSSFWLINNYINYIYKPSRTLGTHYVSIFLIFIVLLSKWIP